MAEHVGETTVWHTVVAFGVRAEALRDSLTVGREVKLAGYLHTREVQSPENGSVKTVAEIYLASPVKPVEKQ